MNSSKRRIVPRLVTGRQLSTITLYLVGICVVAGSYSAYSGEKNSPKRWEKSIAAFELNDKKNPPPKNAILFVGSSSIRNWKLENYFPDLRVINRGFGGSQIADSVYYADRIINKHKPRIVVVYAGDNDINSGKSPKQVSADIEALVKAIRKALPNAQIIFIAIKPSLRRWGQFDDQKQANANIKLICQNDKRLTYADIVTPMLGDDGKPLKNLFVKDGLHMSDAGYRVWTRVIRPLLK